MDKEPKPENSKLKVFDLEDTSFETTYVNTTHTIIGEGDITLYFGFQPLEGNNVPASNVKRMAMTHDSFMRMMEYWAKRYHFLATLYGGKPTTLREMDQKSVSEAFDVMLGRSSEEVEQNESSDTSREEADSFSPAGDSQHT